VKPLPEAVQAAFPGILHGNNGPHPGFRVGQVWAAKDGSSALILRVEDQRVIGHSMVWEFDGFNRFYPRVDQVWAAKDGSSALIRVEDQRVIGHSMVWDFDGFNRFYPYLMADPACPWLAPWSPSEEKTP